MRSFQINPSSERIDRQLNFNLGDSSLTPKRNSDNFSVRWTGTLTAPTTGTYTLALSSDDGSYLYIGDELVIDNGGQHAFLTKCSGCKTRGRTSTFTGPHRLLRNRRGRGDTV